MQLNLLNIILNSSIAYIASALGLLFSLITKIILVKILTPKELGLFFNFQTYFSILVFLCSISLNDYLVRNINNCEIKPIALLQQVVSVSFYPIIIFLSIFIIFFIFINNNIMNIYVFSILIIFIPIKIFTDLIGSYFQSIGMLYIKIIYSDLLNQLIFLLILILILMFFLSISNYYFISFAFLVPTVITFFIFKFKVKSIIFRRKVLHITPIRKILSFSLPLYFAGLMAYPLQFLPLYLSQLHDPSLSAYYGLAISLSSLIFIGVSVTETASFAVFSSLVHKNNKSAIFRNYKFMTKWILLISSIVFCPIFLVPEIIVKILFGVEYIIVASILPTLAIIYFFNTFFGPTEGLIKALNSPMLIYYTRLAIGISALITGFYFVKSWGLWGAIFSYGIAILISIILYITFIYFKFSINPFSKKYFFSLIAIFASLLITYSLKYFMENDLNEIILLLLVITTYIIVLLMNILILPILDYYDKAIISRIYINLKSSYIK